MKKCKKCLLPGYYFRISFDKNGLCNFCRDLEVAKERILNYSRNEQLLHERFEQVRGEYKYDAMIGISGGKDGAYVAYQLKNKFRLRILTYTIDFGLLTDIARQNINKLVRKLEVDHVFYKPKEVLIRKLYRHLVLPYRPCLVCTFVGLLVATRLALENRIPFCVHGRSPYQMLKEFSKRNLDLVRINLDNNLLPYDAQRNRKVFKTSLAQVKDLLNKIIKRTDRQEFYQEIFPYRLEQEILKSDIVPEFLAYFLFEPYDEKKNINLLERECCMVFPTSSKMFSHFDCIIHDAVTYLTKKVTGFSVLEQELSTMIRLGAISREESLRRLQAEACLSEEPVDSLKTLKKMCGIENKSTGGIILKARITRVIKRSSCKLNSFF